MTLDLKDAIQNLHDLPDLPAYDCSDGLLGVEKHAETCIALAARFVTAIEESVAGKELHERVVLFANLTGAGSEYGDLRTAAHESMIQLFKEVSPDREVDRTDISPPYEGFKPRSERLAHGYLRRWDVNIFLGDAQSVLWSPYELLDFCDDLLELFDGQLLCSLVENLGALHGRMKAKHLWGAYLLAASHDAASAPTPDRYRRLRIAIMQSRGSVAAIKAAAEDIVATLPVDSGQTPTKAEEHGGGSRAPVEARPTAEKAAATSGGSASQADHFAKAPRKRKSRGAQRKDADGDRKIYEAWETGHYRTFADCGRELGISEKRDVELAVGRYRKYLTRHPGKD